MKGPCDAAHLRSRRDEYRAGGGDLAQHGRVQIPSGRPFLYSKSAISESLCVILGWALRLKYQPGRAGDPPMAAQTANLSSGCG
jgi:hypothetical protein